MDEEIKKEEEITEPTVEEQKEGEIVLGEVQGEPSATPAGEFNEETGTYAI